MVQEDDGFAGGAEASRRVARDPFWSVVRRRHPDLRIALLPPQAAEPLGPQPLSDVDPDVAVDEAEAEALALWSEVVGDPDPAPATRWVSHRAGGVRPETTLTTDAVDGPSGVGAVLRAGQRLEAAGWQVSVPPAGLPRATATRRDEAGTAELLVLHVPTARRLVLRRRGAPVAFDTETARRLREVAP